MTENTINENGQPHNILLARSRLVDRNIDELIGICKGVLFDGTVVQQEAEMMLAWMNTNLNAANKWPANVLYNRISNMLSDNVLDHSEQAELLDIIIQITGAPAHINNIHSASTDLPITQPPPTIVYQNQLFCVTGQFVSGTRSDITTAITALGGKVKTSPTKKTNYLVIGEIGSRDWVHSTFGRKIEKALEYNQKGAYINIVTEQHWATSIQNHGRST